MQYDLRFFKILLWETLENAPMLIGLLVALRIQSENLILAIIILVIGTACGAILIHFTESRKYSNQPMLKETLVNFAVFTFLAIPFLFYFSANDVWWSNWGTDIVIGILVGYVLSFSESWGWSNKATVKIHALSMGIASLIFLYGIRFTFQLELFSAIVVVGIVLNFFVSIIIVLFDYWPIKTSPEKTEIQVAENMKF